MASTTIIPLIRELIRTKRGDVRQSQLEVLTTLINGSKEKKDLLNEITAELVSLTNTRQKYIRRNCLEFLPFIITALRSILELNVTELFEARTKQLIYDRTPRIKLLAIKLLGTYLRTYYVTKREIKQDIVDELLHLLSCDWLNLSRAHVIENVPFLDKNMCERLLERTRDIDKEVRCCAWRKLADLNFWKHTSVPQLLTLFLQGLKDKDGSVVIAVEQVIKAWLSRAANGSTLKAIQLIGLEKNQESIRQILFALFRCQDYSLEYDYQLDALSEASTFLWLSYIEYVKHFKSVEEWDEATERYLPPIHQFCKVLDKNKQNERVLEKLLRIAPYFDYSDEAGRRKLLKSLKSLLALPYSKKIVSEIIAIVRHLFIDDENESIHFVAAAIALDVRLWPEDKQLLLFSVVLKHFSATKQMFETHRQLMTNGLTSQDFNLRYLAFKCWALCCVTLESLAEQSSTKLFLMALEREKEAKIQRIIFQALFDCILLFKLPSQDQLFNSLRQHFLTKAVSYSVKTRNLLILGFCKCYASGKYQDSLILGHLILKCSSELFEPEKSIRDLIRRFFDCFVNGEISSLFDDSFKRVIVTLLSSSTNIEPLLIFYKRMTIDVKRLQQMASFLINQLVNFTSTSLAKNTLACIEDWTDKDDMIAKCTNMIDNIQHDQIKQTLTEFIVSLRNVQRRKRKHDEQPGDWNQISLSTIISSGLPNKKPKFNEQLNS